MIATIEQTSLLHITNHNLHTCNENDSKPGILVEQPCKYCIVKALSLYEYLLCRSASTTQHMEVLLLSCSEYFVHNTIYREHHEYFPAQTIIALQEFFVIHRTIHIS